MKASIASLMLCSLLAAGSHAEEIYKHIDEQGVPSFSDTPSEGSEKITVEPSDVMTIPAPPAPRTTQTSREQQKITYTRLAISHPADGTTLRNQPSIRLSATLEPALQPDHRLQFLDNGEPLESASHSTTLVLNNFPRGTHKLIARIVDKHGKVIKTSSPITVYVHQTSEQHPPPANPAPEPQTLPPQSG